MSYPDWMKSVFDYIPNLYPSPASSSDEKEVTKTFGELFGTFGDSFGALNTLFSGFAFAGIIISIFLQSKELQETRSEFKSQTDVFNKQSFESTFFQMLHLHNEIIQFISVTNKEKITLTGRAALDDIFYEWGELFKEVKNSRKYNDTRPILMQYKIQVQWHSILDNQYQTTQDLSLNNSYMCFHAVYGNHLGQYFRNIYQVLKYVNQSKIKGEDKKFYTNVLRAQLSSNELGLLFFNCLSELGYEKFKPLLEKYAFFEHLPHYDIFDEEEIVMYKISAYGDTNTNLIQMHKQAKAGG